MSILLIVRDIAKIIMTNEIVWNWFFNKSSKNAKSGITLLLIDFDTNPENP